MTGCNRCGDCCDPVHLSPTYAELVATGEGPQATWLREHWHVIETSETGTRYRCDQFDPEARICTAHESRPQVCRDYPWYGSPPKPDTRLNARCSFVADQRPNLPIAAINGVLA